MLGILDRPHRFKKGDIVRHVDSPEGVDECVVWQLTLRLREVPPNCMIAYPTYVLVAVKDEGDIANDVLCTDDLVFVPKQPVKYGDGPGEVCPVCKQEVPS